MSQELDGGGLTESKAREREKQCPDGQVGKEDGLVFTV